MSNGSILKNIVINKIMEKVYIKLIFTQIHFILYYGPLIFK